MTTDHAAGGACDTCYGSGLETYTDRGGDIRTRECTACGGTGFDEAG